MLCHGDGETATLPPLVSLVFHALSGNPSTQGLVWSSVYIVWGRSACLTNAHLSPSAAISSLTWHGSVQGPNQRRLSNAIQTICQLSPHAPEPHHHSQLAPFALKQPSLG
jgi:hypothetical protein